MPHFACLVEFPWLHSALWESVLVLGYGWQWDAGNPSSSSTLLWGFFPFAWNLASSCWPAFKEPVFICLFLFFYFPDLVIPKIEAPDLERQGILWWRRFGSPHVYVFPGDSECLCFGSLIHLCSLQSPCCPHSPVKQQKGRNVSFCGNQRGCREQSGDSILSQIPGNSKTHWPVANISWVRINLCFTIPVP